MCKHDYIISHIVTGAARLVLIDGNCCKRCGRVVMGCSIKLKCSIDNCQISKMKIGFIESVNGSYLG